MLKDQFKQSEYNMSKIEIKGFNSKATLYESRPLPPKKPPALPKPFKTPTTNYVKPLPPVHAGKGISGGYGGGSPSGPSTASSITWNWWYGTDCCCCYSRRWSSCRYSRYGCIGFKFTILINNKCQNTEPLLKVV